MRYKRIVTKLRIASVSAETAKVGESPKNTPAMAKKALVSTAPRNTAVLRSSPGEMSNHAKSISGMMIRMRCPA